LAKAATPRSRIAAKASLGKRSIYWADLRRTLPTPIYDGALLTSGNRIAGPAVVETTDTTVVVHPRRALKVDAFGNFEITFGR
jgi:N-methylhydantoinase A/oxoprolinase/acetone carboxylase beta subunit